MKNSEKNEILEKARHWFRDTVAARHIANTEKLADPDAFNINPFLTIYLANFLTGNSSPESLAKALVYPRVLGTSITTSFGTNIQRFSSEVLSAFGSTAQGIDVEFIDQVDGQRKYCQLKAGPNTINKDDVESIHGHFGSVFRLARTNHLRIAAADLVVGVLYGTRPELNGHYLRLEKQYHHPVLVGSGFWFRLTGDRTFYQDLIGAIAQAAEESNGTQLLDRTIAKLAQSDAIQRLAAESGELAQSNYSGACVAGALAMGQLPGKGRISRRSLLCPSLFS